MLKEEPEEREEKNEKKRPKIDSEDFHILLKKTRKAYLLEYLCTIFILFVWYKVRDLSLNSKISYFLLGVVIAIIFYIEISRWIHRGEINSSKVLITEGLIKQIKKHIFISSITDVHLDQGYLGRILDYGDILISSSSGKETLEIEDVTHPEEIISRLEKLIQEKMEEYANH